MNEDKIEKKVDKILNQDVESLEKTKPEAEKAKEQALKLQEDYKKDLQCDDVENCG